MFPKGGATVEEIIVLRRRHGHHRPGPVGHCPGSQVVWTPSTRCPVTLLGLPFGLEATDAYIYMALSKMTGKPVPAAIDFERGQVVDVLSATTASTSTASAWPWPATRTS